MFESKKRENNCPSASSLNALDSAFFSYHEIETDKNKNSFPLKLITRNSASRGIK